MTGKSLNTRTLLSRSSVLSYQAEKKRLEGAQRDLNHKNIIVINKSSEPPSRARLALAVSTPKESTCVSRVNELSDKIQDWKA